MEKQEKKTAADYKKTLQKTYKRQNEHIKEHYDRVSITLPKGTKDRITAAGESVNGFIKRVVLQELEKLESAGADQE